MNPIVLSSLIPVVLLITIDFIAGLEGYIRAAATKDLATLVFTVPDRLLTHDANAHEVHFNNKDDGAMPMTIPINQAF